MDRFASARSTCSIVSNHRRVTAWSGSVRKHDLAKAREIDAWINRVCRAVEIIPPDGPIFRTWAVLMKGRVAHTWEDALIAATGQHKRLVVATRNVRDFRGLGVDIFNPFLFK